MKAQFRIFTVLVLLLSLAACKKEQVRETVTAPEPTPEPVSQPDTNRLDARDYTDARNLDNPDSLLYKRTVLFDFDRSEIRSEYRALVAAHATYAAANPTARITLEGHADERGSREYNLGLGERRGNAVSSAMSAQSVRGNQIDVVSYGEERSVCNDSTESCWQRNRRVEIVYTSR
ncbi:MAG: peptidoglycan-associated lipoprotein Pal [Gammaproteobacteria bacterium]|jgi:peptidoglycan-associated lipoprotein|nr:peptidoglycan-associated lipoprotein Pal [Gammaproteobacteria bacterium]